jgi:hypothetical protein
MSVAVKTLDYDRVYMFTYKGKRRVAVLEDWGDGPCPTFHDFLATKSAAGTQFRTFWLNKIEGLRDITDTNYCKIVDASNPLNFSDKVSTYITKSGKVIAVKL